MHEKSEKEGTRYKGHGKSDRGTRCKELGEVDPTIIFGKQRDEFTRLFPHLKMVEEKKMDMLIYPLSGGFHNRNLCPKFLGRVLERGEELLKPFCDYLLFRLFLVLEKRR